MRFALAILLAVHGAIHLLGFLSAWKLAKIPQLTGATLAPFRFLASGEGARLDGALWLVAALLMLTAAALRAADAPWWLPAAIGVVLSQLLVIAHWPEAKAGTVANALLVLPIVVAFAIARFRSAAEAEASNLLARGRRGPTATIVTADELASLPAPTRRWLERTGVVGKPRAQTVRLRQRGLMTTSPGATPMPTEATQYFSVTEPGFVWIADVTMMRVLPIVGRDRFVSGRGRMTIRVLGLVTVADGQGETFDQGTMVRFLSETIWFPSAALAPWVRWRQDDDRHATATMSQDGTTASVTFEIDELGRVHELRAKRYFDGKTLEDWIVTMDRWERFEGIEIPSHGVARWDLASGRYEYYESEVFAVESDPASTF